MDLVKKEWDGMEERAQTLQSQQRTKFAAATRFNSSKVFGGHGPTGVFCCVFFFQFLLLRNTNLIGEMQHRRKRDLTRQMSA